MQTCLSNLLERRGHDEVRYKGCKMQLQLGERYAFFPKRFVCWARQFEESWAGLPGFDRHHLRNAALGIEALY